MNILDILNKLNDIEKLMTQIVEKFAKNDHEHKIIIDIINKDVQNLANKIREVEADVHVLKDKPDKDRAKIVNGALKYILTFVGSGIFLYLISNIPNIIAFFQGLVK